MQLPRGVRRWFRLPLRAADVGHEIDEELQFHIDSRTDDLVREGMTVEAARARALAEFGDVSAARVELSGYARRHVAQTRRAQWWSDLGADFRLAFRSLKLRPGFALMLALTLGLGLGANMVTFDVTDRLLFRPPAHVVDAKDVRRLYFQQTFSFLGLAVNSHTTYADFRDLQSNSRSFAEVGGFAFERATHGRGEGAQRITQGIATASFFEVLGVRPYLGRFYTASEDSPPHGSPVVVLDYDFWQRSYGGRRDILGQSLLLGRQDYTVIGVAPRGFTGAGLQRVDVWTPATVIAEKRLGADFATSRDMIWLQLVARLKPGVTNAQAEQEATALWKRLGEDRIREDQTARVVLAPIQEARGRAEATLGMRAEVAKWLTGVSLLVLLIACANAANLMLARTVRNRRDIGIRMALGVGRMRLLRQLLVEGIVFVAIAAGAALLFAHWGSAVLHSVMLRDLYGADAVINPRMLAFLCIAVLFTLLATMLPPALQMLREAVFPALKSGARDGQQRSRLSIALLFTQAAFSVVLLIGAAMFVRSLQNASRFDLGFEPGSTLVAQIDLRMLEYETVEIRAFYEEAMARVQRLSGVENVAIGSTVPMESNIATEFRAEGHDSVPTLRTGGPYYAVVTPEYFRTMGTRLIEGRAFTGQDRKGTAPVAVLGETMARLLWPNQTALGKCVYVGGDDEKPAPCSTVVGVVEDIRSMGIHREDIMQYYLPMAQEQVGNGMFALFIRTKADPAEMAAPIGREIQSMRADLPYVSVRPLQSIVDPQLASWQMGATLFTVFGILAVLLAGIGLYSMLSWVVASRTKEMGLRMALGARALDVIALVMKDGLTVALAGVVAGIGITVAASKLIAPILFDVSPSEPLWYAVGGGMLLAVAMLASLIPARRATTVEPAITLRAE